MVEYIVAIDVTRVRFPADAFLFSVQKVVRLYNQPQLFSVVAARHIICQPVGVTVMKDFSFPGIDRSSILSTLVVGVVEGYCGHSPGRPERPERISPNKIRHAKFRHVLSES